MVSLLGNEEETLHLHLTVKQPMHLGNYIVYTVHMSI